MESSQLDLNADASILCLYPLAYMATRGTFAVEEGNYIWHDKRSKEHRNRYVAAFRVLSMLSRLLQGMQTPCKCGRCIPPRGRLESGPIGQPQPTPPPVTKQNIDQVFCLVLSESSKEVRFKVDSMLKLVGNPSEMVLYFDRIKHFIARFSDQLVNALLKSDDATITKKVSSTLFPMPNTTRSNPNQILLRSQAFPRPQDPTSSLQLEVPSRQQLVRTLSEHTQSQILPHPSRGRRARTSTPLSMPSSSQTSLPSIENRGVGMYHPRRCMKKQGRWRQRRRKRRCLRDTSMTLMHQLTLTCPSGSRLGSSLRSRHSAGRRSTSCSSTRPWNRAYISSTPSIQRCIIFHEPASRHVCRKGDEDALPHAVLESPPRRGLPQDHHQEAGAVQHPHQGQEVVDARVQEDSQIHPGDHICMGTKIIRLYVPEALMIFKVQITGVYELLEDYQHHQVMSHITQVFQGELEKLNIQSNYIVHNILICSIKERETDEVEETEEERLLA